LVYRSRLPQVIIGEGVYDTKRDLEKLMQLAESVKEEKIKHGELSPEKQSKLDDFSKTKLLGWATGSRVSAELVETAASGMPASPAIYTEPIKQRVRKLRTAFYRHFVRRLVV
jgi:hypothetical protein|tara:strand:- start:141 stop:479 length:339 start_codon:yes stop_codon:yes gene_type:complete